MVTRQSPRPLPGTDALQLNKVLLVIYLGGVVVILALAMATAATIDARTRQLGHLPWPIAQWALTTPLGTLAVALVGGLAWGLAWGLPLLLVRRVVDRPVDVTELPPRDWPRPLLPWLRPGGPTRGEYWLGRGPRQRVLSRLALALALLLVLGIFAAFVAVGEYGITHLPDCSGPRCPPTYGQLLFPPIAISFIVVNLSRYVLVRHVERRCGIWFRSPDGTLSGYITYYVRRPGLTADAAAAGLVRYTREEVKRPAAQQVLRSVLFFVPYFLVLIALSLLIAWLPTQWIPA